MPVHGIYDEPVTLVDGRSEGDPFVPGAASRPEIALLDDLWVQADLDGDGRQELAVLLAESSGGSGTRLHVAIAERKPEGADNVATAPDAVTIGSIRATRRACVPEMMNLEQRVLQELGNASHLGFLMGDLILSTPSSKGGQRLRFTPMSTE